MKRYVFWFTVAFGVETFPVEQVKEQAAKPKTVQRSPEKCSHEKVREEPDLIGEITPEIVCESCSKSWSYPGRRYLELRQPKALEQLREYEAVRARLK